MSDDLRFDRYLDGDEPLDGLPADLRVEETLLREALGEIREEIRAQPGFRAEVMHAVRSVRPPAWRRVLDWWARPRTIELRPATAGLALAAATSLVLLVGVLPSGPSSGGEVAAEPHVTRFVFVAPQAASVQVTGDFVGWSPDGIDLRNERGTGVWTVDVPLEPGVYQYAFIVDGAEWAPDPRAVSQVDDGFGRENSVVIVSADSET